MTTDVEETQPEVEQVEVDGKSISKSEQKARKAMAKLGLKSVPDINRVVIRQKTNSMFIIAEADVFKSANGESNLFFLMKPMLCLEMPRLKT